MCLRYHRCAVLRLFSGHLVFLGHNAIRGIKMKLLHIDTSILGAGSASRELTAAIVERISQSAPGVEVVYRDLVAENVPHLTIARLPGEHPLSAMAGDLDSAQQALRDQSEQMLNE